MLIDRPGRVPANSAETNANVWLTVGVALGSLLLLVAAQVYASMHNFSGPLVNIWHDYVGTPSSSTVSWAGLGLAMVGIPTARRRFRLGLIALAIDLVFLAVRSLQHIKPALGNGPTIVLTVFAIVVAVRWTGTERATALRAMALGALLIGATKVADTWLWVTSLERPMVIDQYIAVTDRALGNPSWLVGRFLQAAGVVPTAIVHFVYIELPFAVMVVAVWQLRNVTSAGWPRHYLVRTFLILGLIGPIFYVLFPVVGPVFAYGDSGNGYQLGNFWPDTVPPMTNSPVPFKFDSFTPRNCMPSMHNAWAMGVFIHSRSGPKWLRWAGALWLVCTLVATLGFGYHYGADVLVGFILCFVIESTMREPERGWDRYRVRLVGVGTFAFVALLLSYRYLPVEMAEYPVVSGILMIGTLGAVAATFYATWFATPGTPIANWGGRAPAVESDRPSSSTTAVVP